MVRTMSTKDYLPVIRWGDSSEGGVSLHLRWGHFSEKGVSPHIRWGHSSGGVVSPHLIIGIFLVAISVLLLPGCWDRKDPETIAIVLATAFDYDEERNMYQVFAEIAVPRLMEAEEGDRPERASWVVSAEGFTPYKAMSNLTVKVPREMFWGHSRILLFSEKMARRGIGDIIDAMGRTRQPRLITRPVAVKGDLQKLMSAELALENTFAIGMERIIITVKQDKSVFKDILLIDLIRKLEEPGQEMVIGKITLSPEHSNDNNRESSTAGQGAEDVSPVANVGGCALFRGDRLVGWYDENQSEGWLLARGMGNRFVFTTTDPEDEDKYFTVEVFRVISDWKLTTDNREPRIKIQIQAEGTLKDYAGHESLEEESEYVRSLSDRCAQVIRNRIKDALVKSQEVNADALGLGNFIYRKDYKLWKELEPRWDEIFPELEVDVEVIFIFERSGLITDPARPG